MNTPLSDEMKEKLISDTNEYKYSCLEDNSKLKRIITAAKSKTIIISGLGFELEVYSAIPGPVKDKLAMTQLKLANLTEYSEIKEMITEVEAEFMAKMCVDSELKSPEVWIEFEYQTGMLEELVGCIIGETTGTDEKVKNFRRKP